MFRRCACRGADGRQLGARCPKLAADSRHGSWTLALEQPTVNSRRSTLRRSGFPAKRAAQRELEKLTERQRNGIASVDRERGGASGTVVDGEIELGARSA